jgi:hypothetical protein
MHAILFGYSPPNQEYLKDAPSGYPLYTSQAIDKLWVNKKGESIGFHSIAEANEATAYYIASYALKGQERTIIHPETGEQVDIRDQMDVSKRPAIGLKFLMKNAEQIVNTNTCLPRYYVKKLEEHFPDLHEEYQNKQMLNFVNRSDHGKFAKIITTRQKTALHSSEFREDYGTDTGYNKKNKEQDFRQQILKHERDNYALKQREKHAKNLYT